MKRLYLGIMIVTVLLLLVNSAITIAIPQEFYVAITLEEYPDTWEVAVKDRELPMLERVNVKAELRKFIAENKQHYSHQDMIAASCFIVLVFSAIGYCRERMIEKARTRECSE